MRVPVPLGFRLLVRDWRAGELRLMVLAVAIAVGVTSAIGFFGDRMTRAMGARAGDLLGADLVLAGPQPLDTAAAQAAAAHPVRAADSLEFASVVTAGDRLQLAQVKAVAPGYPARGVLRTAPALFAADAPTTQVPAAGEAWVEARLLAALGLAVGGRVEIGAAEFVVSRVLTHDVGAGGGFIALAPRVLIARSEVERTQIVQPGSRVTYRTLYAGAAADIDRLRAWLEPRLSANQELHDGRGGNSSIGRALERAERYLGLASLLAVVLAGIAVAMAARRYSERHYDAAALLRCFGASQGRVLRLYAAQVLLLGVIGGGIGGAIGWLAQYGLLFFLRGLIPANLPPPGLTPLGIGFVTGLVLLIGFALPPLTRLRHVPPLRVLRRELAPLPVRGIVVYGAALLTVTLLMWRYTASAPLTLAVLAGAIAAGALLALIAALLLRAARRLPARVGVAWRFGVNNLWRNARASVGQILAFGLALMAMAVIALVRADLLSAWQTQLPPATPNHFAFNILPPDVSAVGRFFLQHQVPSQALYPLVRGRLIEINGAPVRQAVTKEARDDNAVQRELNLTWTEHLPPDNRLVRGHWWRATEATPLVSVEEKLAARLNIQLGDRLTFSIGGNPLEATVTSLRSVQWDSFHPNFYMIFPPGVLDPYPATYLTSFYLTPAQKPLLRQLVQEFPAVTVLEMERVLEQVRSIVAQVTAAVEFILLFVLAAGLAVLYAALQATLDERLYDGALLRALGASRRQLRSAHVAEFAGLGLAAGLLAAIGTELIAYLLYAQVFHLDYRFKWPVWVIAPIAGALLVGSAGYVGTRRIVQASPLALLRRL